MAYASPLSNAPVITADEDTRGAFLVRVYQHVALAVLAFMAFETVLFMVGAAEGLYNLISGSSAIWLLILGGFMVVQWLASQSAHNLANPGMQYAGLFGMAGAEALIFAPFLYMVFNTQGEGAGTVAQAAVVTVAGFIGLTIVGMITRKDLSFMRPMIMFGGIMALVLIGAAVLFGLNLGLWFSLGMVALTGASILYQTQNIIRTYPAWAHVGAAVSLFASLMTMFWYVLRIFSRR
ncbi:MAG: Bax inhibitor-1 family protein [Acidimicrobiales bacterium]